MVMGHWLREMGQNSSHLCGTNQQIVEMLVVTVVKGLAPVIEGSVLTLLHASHLILDHLVNKGMNECRVLKINIQSLLIFNFD